MPQMSLYLTKKQGELFICRHKKCSKNTRSQHCSLCVEKEADILVAPLLIHASESELHYDLCQGFSKVF